MRRRGALAEHPFGTLKCRAGYRHFLLRGFDKVRGEWGLMALCYNFTRVLNILGLDRFMAYLAARHSSWAILLFNAVIVVTCCLQIGRPRLRVKISHNAAAIRPAFNYAL
jgi:DDE family transposase